MKSHTAIVLFTPFLLSLMSSTRGETVINGGRIYYNVYTIAANGVISEQSNEHQRIGLASPIDIDIDSFVPADATHAATSAHAIVNERLSHSAPGSYSFIGSCDLSQSGELPLAMCNPLEVRLEFTVFDATTMTLTMRDFSSSNERVPSSPPIGHARVVNRGEPAGSSPYYAGSYGGQVNDVRTFTFGSGQYDFVFFAETVDNSWADNRLAYDFDFTVSFSDAIEEPGFGQHIPVLPEDGTTGSFSDVRNGAWCDPPATDGFHFQMTNGSKFTDVFGLPVGIDGDGFFTVVADGQQLGTYAAGQAIDFAQVVGHAVTSFTVLGIDPVVNAENPTAFPIQLGFDTPTADFTMTPSTLFAEGDANLDGQIDFDDLLTLAQNYGDLTEQMWTDGDFNFDGAVVFDDLLTLAQHYSQGAPDVTANQFGATFAHDWALARALIPEPLFTFPVVGLTMLRRTRHSRNERSLQQ